ncbi:MAG: 50S ribosomal protein L33 [Patescibacteria group bacterium]
MAQSKYTENLVKLRCTACKRIGYYTHRHLKRVEKKLELSKYCKWCRKHTVHKEAKR